MVKSGASDSFERLVLPGKHKNVVRALVNTHARQVEGGSTIISGGQSPDLDLVKGKGQGLVILLHGAPGVGKTSTAECVAAQAGRPLLPITCGDLGGASPSEVEESLEKFFYLARKWGCVLLLDEADVFVTSRNKSGNVHQIMLASGKLSRPIRTTLRHGNQGPNAPKSCRLTWHSLPQGSRVLLRDPHPDNQPRRRL